MDIDPSESYADMLLWSTSIQRSNSNSAAAAAAAVRESETDFVSWQPPPPPNTNFNLRVSTFSDISFAGEESPPSPQSSADMVTR